MSENSQLPPPNSELPVPGSELRTPNSELKSRRVFLIDGNSYLYRAFFATPYLSNSKGVPTNATYAFLSMIKKLLNEEKPDPMVIIFDSKGPSFREEISKAYKAQRPPMPGNLTVQIPYVKAVVEAMGLPMLEKEGFEADDIIGTLVEELKRQDAEVFIVTSDKDMMQLVSEHVCVYDTMKNQIICEKEVEEKFGVKPSLIVDYLALCGDTSDNIPGVPGVGDKTARELVASLGSMEEIYERIDEIKKPSVREKLIQGKDLGLMSKQLATLRIDVPVDTDLGLLRMREPDEKALKSLFRELEFTSLYRSMKTDAGARTWNPVGLTELDMKNIALLVRFRGKNPYEAALEGFAAYDGKGLYYSNSEDELLQVLGRAEEIVTHNLKPLLMFLRKRALYGHGTDPVPRSHLPMTPLSHDPILPSSHDPMTPLSHCPVTVDTMLATYLVNPLRKDFSAAAVLEEYLDVQLTGSDTSHVLSEGVTFLPDLKDALLGAMKEMGLSDLFYNVEMPLVEVLAHMEYWGVRIDRRILHGLSQDFDRRLTSLMKDIYQLAGGPFNINSPQQLSRVLFETLQLPTRKKTKTGYSTDTEVLEALSGLHALPKEILEYRSLTKLKGTYIDVLPTLINPHTGRIHASFNQMVTATGRLSSSDPNLQNIPIRGEEGMKIREAFVPADGFILLSSDYSQIELRVLAHISGDPVLVETFLRNEDIHTRVAQEVFGVGPEGVTHDMRRAAKVINFGIIYGMSSYGLSKELAISQREAQTYINDYFWKHKGVKEYMDKVLQDAREKGFVSTLFGRMRYIPEINNPDAAVRQLGERAAMNMPIQGTAADIIKMAMVNIHRKIEEGRLASRLIMQIHDELVFEVKEDEGEVMDDLVRREMETVVALSVPLKVSLGKGKNWASAHD
jgi:DNA polymerase I